MHSTKLCWHIRHLESRKQCSLSGEHVSIRDREKPRYTIGAWSARSRICTMDERTVSLLDRSDWTARVLCLCQLCRCIQPTDRTALLALAYHAVTRPPYRRFYSPDLSVSLSFSCSYDRESAIVVANDSYLPTITVYLCVYESDSVIRREVFPIPRGSLWIMELNLCYTGAQHTRKSLTLSFSVAYNNSH